MIMEKITNTDLFNFLVERFDKIDNRLDRVELTQDFVLGELKDLKEEKIVGNYRSQRMESWIAKAAKKIKLPYNP